MMTLNRDNIKQKVIRITSGCRLLSEMTDKFQDDFDEDTKAKMATVMAVVCSDVAYDAESLKNLFKGEYNGKK